MRYLFQLPKRYFCVRSASAVTFKFDLPAPEVNLDTLPAIFSLNSQPYIALAMLNFSERYKKIKDPTQDRFIKLLTSLGEKNFALTFFNPKGPGMDENVHKPSKFDFTRFKRNQDNFFRV